MNQDDTITTATPKQELLFALGLGQAQGQTAEALAANIGVNPPAIPALIHQLQLDGQLVVEDAGRYFIAATLDEWRAYRDRCFMEAAVDLAQRHRAMTRTAASRWPRQWRTLARFVIGGEAA